MKKLIFCLIVGVIFFTPSVYSQNIENKNDTTYFKNNGIKYAKIIKKDSISLIFHIENVDDKYQGENKTRLKIYHKDSTKTFCSKEHRLLTNQLTNDLTTIFYDYIKKNLNNSDKKRLLEAARSKFYLACYPLINPDASVDYITWSISSLDAIREKDIANLDMIIRKNLIIKIPSGLHEKYHQTFVLIIRNHLIVEFLEKELKEK